MTVRDTEKNGKEKTMTRQFTSYTRVLVLADWTVLEPKPRTLWIQVGVGSSHSRERVRDTKLD